MVLHFKFVLFLLLSAVFLADNCVVKKSFPIRVLLETIELNKHIAFESHHGFLIWDSVKPDIKMHNDAKKCTFLYKKAGLLCNKKRVKSEILCVAARDGHIIFQGKAYQGIFLLVNTGKNILIINVLDIEDYVFSVLKTESWPGWPLEVNKAFAIASRSYALAMMLQAKKTKRHYDVKNSNIHQTYTGIHGCTTIRKAVEQTKGIFLTHNKRPIIAMFDCCCGGVIPAHIDGINFNDAPYLARNYACHYCKSCSLYAWKCKYDLRYLEDQIGKIHGRIKRLRDFTITQRDKAGLVLKVDVKNGTKPLLLSGKQLCSLLKEAKSSYFKIRRLGNDIIVEGNGYGHLQGLCQWGARQMVREGYSYKQILQFYYPHTTFMKLD